MTVNLEVTEAPLWKNHFSLTTLPNYISGAFSIMTLADAQT
ncbi:hypothetical protein BKP42_66800 [Rhodococcus erythropolis]|nr:hypothetical protein [Rhodococcus erythropolis]PBI84779.1 hypothetical protein BKP42_66800 [Rhodococcus erythropolis]